MKLFKMDVHTKKRRQVLEVVAHAETASAAEDFVQKKFTGAEIRNCIEISAVPVHFVVGELETD